ncbi:MAG: chromosomal replication initiator protein DnaA [Hyphomicrobiaceae bacterium]
MGRQSSEDPALANGTTSPTELPLQAQSVAPAAVAVAVAVAGSANSGDGGEQADTAAANRGKNEDIKGVNGRGQKARAVLRGMLGDEVISAWFAAMEFDSFEDGVVRLSFPTKFLKTWIQSHYVEQLLDACKSEFTGAEAVEIVLRQPGTIMARPAMETTVREPRPEPAMPAQPVIGARALTVPATLPQLGRTHVGGFEGSPLDPRYTLDSFVVGASNRMAHAGATQVAETVRAGSTSTINPLFIHAAVGLGKTHLLHAIAWEVQRRAPSAQVLYLTAERFRYQFVEALKSSDPLAFKDKFRAIDILLIDDLEFLQGQQTEQEFDHIINALLDGGRQVVVASARPPSQMEKLNERMRSRLQRGLVTEIGPLDAELRLRVLERRLQEKRQLDPSFEISRDVLGMLAERLTESGRELEGVITRLHATWQYMRTPITVAVGEQMIRDLLQGVDPRRIKIEEILRVVARHYCVSRNDILSERRHRSVVWPRQIGMYLAKQLTSRSLPEIGRRFGGRDHTTVLHAIRKVEAQLAGDPGLKEELENLKKLLGGL